MAEEADTWTDQKGRKYNSRALVSDEGGRNPSPSMSAR
jgi:hypothetical protein